MIIAGIHNKFKSLTATEQKIANYVLTNPSEVIRLTAKELAERCDSAPSAVIRFCKSLNVDGFSEFKIKLASEIGDTTKQDVSKLPSFSSSDSVGDVFAKVFTSGVNTLKDTLNMIDMKNAEMIAKVLKNANRLFLFGVGTSSVIVIDAQYRFSQLGLNVTGCTDALFMNVTAINMKEGDVAVGISHSGRTKAVVDALARAKEAGAITVAITSFQHAPLAQHADYSVCVFADEENYPVEAVSARMAHMCLIDAFTMTLATMEYDEFKKHVTGRNRILEEIRY
ncbi:MAG: MurR/RpiR family transcriptional regulator [Clostridiales bacterium]|nr:MurR/RpiR family transcriptional regulator [Clostridiales bacterium]